MKYEDLVRLVDDRTDEGEFNVHRDIFRDPEIFELEMRHIFEGTWVFLGMTSQLPNPHDFLTTWIGRQPVVIMRDKNGKLGAFLNTCRHRGAILSRTERGNSKLLTCPYHGWVYDSSGKNLNIKDQKHGGYTEAFNAMDHDLVPVARFGEYRGFLFGSANADVPALEEHLGSTRKFIDLVIDQSPQGIELVPGCSTYVYKGNWKLQIENCVDGYHLSSTHTSYIRIVERRASGESNNNLKALDLAALRDSDVIRGGYTFKYGHATSWSLNDPNRQVRPLYVSQDEVRSRVGEQVMRWMFGNRSLTLFPNVQLVDNAAMQLRIIRPLSVDRTEMRIYCLGPVGESGAMRERRLRQYEDFFNATGLATPDDTTLYEDCQSGYEARGVAWQQGYARGMTVVKRGPDQYAVELGVDPATSISGPYLLQNETIFHSCYREWSRLMKIGVAPAIAPHATSPLTGGTGV